MLDIQNLKSPMSVLLLRCCFFTYSYSIDLDHIKLRTKLQFRGNEKKFSALGERGVRGKNNSQFSFLT